MIFDSFALDFPLSTRDESPQSRNASRAIFNSQDGLTSFDFFYAHSSQSYCDALSRALSFISQNSGYVKETAQGSESRANRCAGYCLGRGELRVIAFIAEPKIIGKILRHLRNRKSASRAPE
jgi:hypothetical protein